MAEHSDWRRASLVLVCGIFAASQAGKLAPAIPQMREVFGASLVQLGWLASIINLVAAASGLALGLLADRIGRYALLKAGLFAIGAGAATGLLASDLPLLYVSRGLEGVGFVCIVVAAPVLIRDAVAPAVQRLALGAWSAYIAIGLTLMMLATPWSIPILGWKGGWWLGVTGAILLLALTLWSYPGSGRRCARGSSKAGIFRGLHVSTPWWLAATFGIFTMQWMALMVWMPTFLLEQGGVTLIAAGGIVALMIAVNAPGNILGGWLAFKGVPVVVLMAVPVVVMGSCSWLIFALMPPPIVVAALGAALSFFGGILPASINAFLPAVAARHDNLGAINGIVVQAANLGMLAGPPLLAAVVSLGGWQAVAPLFMVASLACLACGVAGCRNPDLRTAPA